MKFNLFVERKSKAFLMTLLFALSFGFAQAQTINVKGTVTGDGQPLPGASVAIKGASKGVVTDFDGNFEIATELGSVLVFNYLGYATKSVKVTGKTLNVVLKEDSTSLDEIVVVGYGTQKKKEVTGAVAQIKNEALVQSATADLGTALQGQIAGVNVTASDGAPGGESNITIRGISSILGSSTPLYVVDGIPFVGDPKLSMNEIETIDVLKDAASAAIYGTRGAGGVVLITTKKGKEGIMKMNVETYYGIQSITSGVPLMEIEDFLYVRHLRSAVLNGTTFGNTFTPIVNGPHQLTNNTNLTDIIQNDFAPIQNHSIGISGGKEGLTYSVNATVFSQDGTIINSGYDRFNVRANTQFKKGKWSVNTGIGFGVEQKESAPWQFLLDAYKYNPYSQLLDPSLETVQHPGPPTDNDAGNLANNLRKFKQTDNDNTDSFNANITLNYQFNKYLTYTIRGGLSYKNNTRIVINPLFKAFDEDGEEIVQRQRSGIRNESGRSKNSTIENILNYKRSFGDHNIQLTAAYAAERYESAWFFAEQKDLVSNDVLVLNGALNDPVVGSGTGWRQNVNRGTIGILGRLQYNYKGKYLFSASARRDGSSRFASKFRYNTFPSLSLGWNVSSEEFWEPIKQTISSFKLRASRGTVGNDNFQDYSNAPVIIINRDYIFGAEGSDRLVQGAIQKAYANPNIKWETSVSNNVGFDLGFFRNKLNISGDFYSTEKEDLLLGVLLPPTLGTGTDGTVILNVGNMVNKGMEFSMNYKQAGDFSWNTGLTFTKNVNEVTKMSSTNKLQFLNGSEVVTGVNNEDKVTVIAEGYEVGAYFLHETDGIIKTQEELDAYNNSIVGGNAQLGDLKYVDQITEDTNGDGIPDKGDGVIDANDKRYAGSGTPDFEMGFNFGAEYKNFDFSMQWYASFGAEIMNGSKAFAYKANTHRDLLYQWTPQNPTSDLPTNRGGDYANYRGFTDFWLEDGTFARLRNVAIGYTIPKYILEKNGISKIRIYLSAQNPLTITKYTGFDPEVGGNGLATKGLDRGNYPISSTWRVGIQFTF